MSAITSPMEWFPFYVQRFLTSRRVRRMTAEQVGVYVLLLCEQWDGGPLPDDDKQLTFMAKAEPSIARGVLQQCFKLSESGWENPELVGIKEEQEAKRQKFVEAGRRGGKAKAANHPSHPLASLKPPSSNRVEEKRVEQIEETTFVLQFDEFWSVYPKRRGSNPKKTAKAKWELAQKNGTSAEEIQEGVKRFREFCDSEQHTGTEFVPMATTWLNQKRWEDDMEVTKDDNGRSGHHIDLAKWSPEP